MIEVQGLCFDYAGTEVLTGIDFSVPQGHCVGLLGGNGSGKSTLLTLLAGLFSPARGRIRTGRVTSPGQERQLRQTTGLLLQEADLQILGATVREDLELSLRNSRVGHDRPARELAARFGLSQCWDLPVQHLSGGQKRKLCLAAVLLQRPEILLFDEPFSGLDYPASKEFRAILQDNQQQGITQIVAVHDLDPLQDIVDDCLLLHQGSLVRQGRLAELQSELEGYDIRPPGRSWGRN